MSIYFALLALTVSGWLLFSVLGLVHRIGGSNVGPARAGALALISFAAFAKIALAISYAVGELRFGIDTHAGLWVSADHLSNALLMIGVGLMVRGGFRLSDQPRKSTPGPTPLQNPVHRPGPKPSNGGQLARARH